MYSPFVYNLTYNLIARKGKLIDTFETHGLEHISNENTPTLFLANHIDQFDALRMNFAIQKQGRQHLRSVFKRGVLDNRKLGKIQTRLFNPIAKLHGGILIYPPDNQVEPREGKAMTAYLKALEAGHSVLLFPYGRISMDGKIDYSQNNGTFTEKHLAFLHDRVFFNQQFVHTTYDALDGKYHFSFGEQKSDSDVDFLKQFAACTKITPLQLYEFLHTRYLDKGQKLNQSLYLSHAMINTDIADLMTSEIDPQDNSEGERIKWCRRYGVKEEIMPKLRNLVLFKQEIDTTNKVFLENQIKHMEGTLDTLLDN